METTILTLTVKPVGKNGFKELRDQLNMFVLDNFDLLYEGAVRLGCYIPADYWAPKRVQINGTRLHEALGLKYADRHKYDDECAPSMEQLRQTVNDLQELIDAASKDVIAPFTLIIKKNN